jgi:hypothetical protein
LALSVAHEAIDQFFARIDDASALVGIERGFAHDVSVRRVLRALRCTQPADPLRLC